MTQKIKLSAFIVLSILFLGNQQTIGSEEMLLPSTETIRNNAGQVIQINRLWAGRVQHVDYFLPEEEFLQKLLPYKHVCHSGLPRGATLCKNLPTQEDALILPIPERGGIVCPVDPSKNLQFETAGIVRCVAIAAWNTQRIGCLHYDRGTTLDSLNQFINDLTDKGRLTVQTNFFLVTNHLTDHLREVYEFLLKHASENHISVDASYKMGGYVPWETDGGTTSYFYDQTQKDADNKDGLEGKALSFGIMGNGETMYAFSASRMTERLQDYFTYLDSTYCSFVSPFLSSYLSESNSQNWQEGYWQQHSPQNCWEELRIRFPAFIDAPKFNAETKALQLIATKLYNAFKNKPVENPTEIIYLHDSLEGTSDLIS